MDVAKRFRWEAAHRIPWHEGGCENLHGHSYEMWIRLTGTKVTDGMVIDFHIIKKVIKPLVDALDHAVLVAKDDSVLLKAVKLLDSKYYIFPTDTTSENLCSYVTEFLCENAIELLMEHGITDITVMIKETETCYAELKTSITANTFNEDQKAILIYHNDKK